MDWSSWGQVVTWCLVLAGWVIVNYQNNQRERRKEQRASIDSIKKQLADLEEGAVSFHTSKEFDHATRRRLQYQIHRLSDACQRLQLCEPQTTVKPIAALRQAITLNNADPTTFVPQEPTSPLLDDIYAAGDDVIDAVEGRFIAEYGSVGQSWRHKLLQKL
ncbi:MAG: hypothetical protein ING80_07270 [Rhodocyclaceae bacterium]|jgi:hypothetical protein|nr:hypothetical protein [Rhodocyclaceae bacterium]MCA3142000.1 hypothetical protein [Rhodocyclaceae bacterium]MCA3144909.1 hypothetical protein [Rhodocyclaceae bacterium]